MPDIPAETAVVVSLDVVVAVTDRGALRAFLEARLRARQNFQVLGQASSKCWPVPAMVREALIFSSKNPPPASYGIRCLPGEGRSFSAGRGTVRVQQDIAVVDEVALWKYALARYRACWFAEMAAEKSAEEVTLQQAVLEAVILSNENPNPVDYGLEIHDFAARVHRGSPGQPRSYKEIEATLLG